MRTGKCGVSVSLVRQWVGVRGIRIASRLGGKSVKRSEGVALGCVAPASTVAKKALALAFAREATIAI